MAYFDEGEDSLIKTVGTRAMPENGGIMNYGDKRATVESNIARSGLAGVGSGEQALQNYDELFQLQQAKAALSAESRKFERDLRLRGRERSIASAGFALDKAAAEKGLKTSYGSSLMDLTNLG